MHCRLNFRRNISRQFNRRQIINRLRLHNYTNFTTSRNCVSLINPFKARSDIFQIAHSLCKVFSRNITSARTCSRSRITDSNNNCLWSCRFDIIVVCFDCVNNSLIHAIFTSQFRPNVMVLALNFMRHRFTDIMEKCSNLRNAHIRADFFSNHSSNLCHLSRMLQNVLPKTGTEFQLTKKQQHLLRNPNHASFAHSIFTSLANFFLNLFLSLGNNLFNARRMNTTVLH